MLEKLVDRITRKNIQVKDKILLVDSMNFGFRANITFGKPKPEDEDKESFTAVFNFFRNLRAMIEQFDPDKVFFALEGQNIFRYDLYSEYKQNRIIKVGTNNSEDKQKKRDDFLRQYNIILKLLKHLPITQVKSDRYEADDVIATLVSTLKDEELIVISSDKDYIQLLQKGYDNLKVYSHSNKGYVVPPDYHFLTFLALNGDTSDNIPSLISKKKAIAIASDVELLKQFLSVEENRANYALNKELVEFRIIEDDALEFSEYEVDFDALKEEFEWMEFDTILAEKYWNRFVETFERLR
jgi:5'-3' exonuclease